MDIEEELKEEEIKSSPKKMIKSYNIHVEGMESKNRKSASKTVSSR
jgi:GTP cyclohydrolase I